MYCSPAIVNAESAHLVAFAILVPDDIGAFLPGNQYVQVAVAIHVDEANVVSPLILKDVVLGEIASAVVWNSYGF